MEITESTLENQLKKLKTLIENKVQGLNPTEIAVMYPYVPRLLTILEYRERRLDFLADFNSPLPIPQVTLYSEALLTQPFMEIDLSIDIRSTLQKFFNNELKRVQEITQIVVSRCQHPRWSQCVNLQFTQFIKNITEYNTKCQNGLLRANHNSALEMNPDDLQIELISSYSQRKKKMMLKDLISMVRRLPISSRRKIFDTIFSDIEGCFAEDAPKLPVPFMITKPKNIDTELLRLAKRFNINPDLESNDGQQFLYFADKMYEKFMSDITINELKKVNIDIPDVSLDPEIIDLVQDSLLTNLPNDIRLQAVFESIFYSDYEVSAMIKETTSYYNTFVGNQVPGQSITYEKNKELIPVPKLVAWYELRFIHMKFLAASILSILNYFEYVKIVISNPKEQQKYTLDHSPGFPDIIYVKDDKGPFMFQSAYDYFESLEELMIGIGSYYISKADHISKVNKIPDRETVAEQLFEDEFRFINAKRSIVQVLMEILQHGNDESVVNMIYSVMAERPHYNLQSYKCYQTPYNIAIELMEIKAKNLRNILNYQVLFEQQLSVRLSNTVPDFDKPYSVPFEGQKHRIFPEGILLSPFEVYNSVRYVVRFLTVVPNVAREFAEAADLKFHKVSDFCEIAIWKEIETILSANVKNGLFPYDRASFDFKFLLSDSVNSLFTSTFCNSASAFIDMQSNMNEGRRVRFLLAARRFHHYTHKLQKLIIDTNTLQVAYFEQCDNLGIAERSVLLGPYSDALRDGIDVNGVTGSDKIIDFAYNEYRATSINFASSTTVKDILMGSNFSTMQNICRFQLLQNSVLEIACRYNQNMMDSNYLVDHFELNMAKQEQEVQTTSTEVFLTAANEVDNNTQEEEPGQNNQFFKQYVAAQILYQSTAIYRDNQIAKEGKNEFYLPIKILKCQVRTQMSAQTKQTLFIKDEEVMPQYMKEIMDACASYAFRFELVRLTNLERQILQSNTFIDTYVLGPDPAMCLVNEAGRFEKFYYVPTWVENYKMITMIGNQRQGVLLKPILHYILARLRILMYLRFESSLQQKSTFVFRSVYDQTYMLESPIFQRIFNELGRLPNGREVEISAEYLTRKADLLFYRLEYTILAVYETFFVSMNVEKKRSFNESLLSEDKKKKSSTTGTDPTTVKNMNTFWLSIHNVIKRVRNTMQMRRYIPLWLDQFLYQISEAGRSDLVAQITTTDVYIEDATASMKTSSFMDSITLLPNILDFMRKVNSQFAIKFAYFLLLNRTPEHVINSRSVFSLMTQKMYVEGLPMWNDVILKQALDYLVPKEERAHGNVIDKVSESKMVLTIADIVKTQVDTLLLSTQIKQIQGIINKFSSDLATLKDKTNIVKPKFIDGTCPEMSDQIFVIKPQDATMQFDEELRYSHAIITNMLFNALDSCTLERKNHDNTFSTLYDGDAFEEICAKLSRALQIFLEGSHSDFHLTWCQYISTALSQIDINNGMFDKVEIMRNFGYDRFKRHVESEEGVIYFDHIIHKNRLSDQLRFIIHTKNSKEQEMDERIRAEFDVLINDLQKQIGIETSKFIVIRRQVYTDVLERINRAKEVKMDAHEYVPDSSRESKVYNDALFAQMKTENEDIRHKTVKMRIFRVLNDIAIRHFYHKRLLAVESDRKAANASLRINKLAYEAQEAQTEKQLVLTHQRLTDTEIEIERNKQLLENEKMSNIQLVHWKAKNTKTIENLKKQLTNFKGIGDVNIDNLLQKLSERQDILDVLLEDSNQLDNQCEQQIRKPMRKVERVRTAIGRTRCAKSALLTTRSRQIQDEPHSAPQGDRSRKLLEENKQLKHVNEILRRRVAEAENNKIKQASDTKNFMETTFMPQPTKRGLAKTPGAIIRPLVPVPRATRA